MIDNAKQKIGLPTTLALVVGSIIGAGIFMLPVALAPLGWNAAIGWLVSGSGALCLAYGLAQLTRGGQGVQAHIEQAFGAVPAFIAAWSFWCAAWTSNAALAIAAASALSRIDPRIADPPVFTAVAVSLVAVLTFVNALGVRSAGRMQILTTAIKILPLLAVILILMLRGAGGEAVQPLPATPITFDNIAIAAALTLYALTGFEYATTLVNKVREAPRTLPRAIVGGTAFVALLYLVSSTAVVLVVPANLVASSAAPFADALASAWGEVAVIIAAFCIAVSAFGALNSGILASGELAYAMALKRDLPRPFARTRRDGTPVLSQCFASALAVTLIVLNSSRDTASLFTFVILLATVGTLVMYLLGALGALKMAGSTRVRLVVAIGTVFALFAFYGSGWEANAWGLVLITLGLAVRTVTRLLRARLRSSAVSGPPAA
jgi:APA family basic amino acid/polyamine antiporter